MGETVAITGNDRSNDEQVWIMTTTDGNTIDVFFHDVSIERAFDRLVIGYGDDPKNASTVVGSSDIYIAHYYRIYHSKVWITYQTDSILVDVIQGFTADVESISHQGEYKCYNCIAKGHIVFKLLVITHSSEFLNNFYLCGHLLF